MKNILNSHLILKFIFFGIIFFSTFYLLIGNVLIGDDINASWPKNISSFIEFDVPWGATWIMNLMYILMYKLPWGLNINIQDWNSLFCAFFKSMVITIFFVYLYKFFDKQERKYTPFLIIITIFLFYNNFIITISPYSFYVSTAFFRFLIPNLFFVMFIYYLLKFMNNEKVNIAFFSVIAFLTGSSQECIGTMAFLILFLCIILSFIKEKNKNKTLVLLLITIILVSGMFMLISASQFAVHVQQKSNGILSAINDIKNNWDNCISSYMEYFIKRYIIFFFVLPILWLLNIKKEKNIIDYTNYISFFVFLSGVVLSVILIFLGKTHYSGGFWILHPDIHTILYTVFLVALIISLCPILRYKYYNVLLLTISIILIGLTINPFINNYVQFKKSILNIKDFMYLHDKMICFYIHKQEIPVMPYSFHENNLPCIVDLKTIEKEDCSIVNISNSSPFPPLLKSFMFHPEEYYDFYGVKSEWYNPIILKYRQDATNYFTSLGGSYNEIKTHKYHFSDLRNRNFVLNSQTL